MPALPDQVAAGAGIDGDALERDAARQLAALDLPVSNWEAVRALAPRLAGAQHVGLELALGERTSVRGLFAAMALAQLTGELSVGDDATGAFVRACAARHPESDVWFEYDQPAEGNPSQANRSVPASVPGPSLFVSFATPLLAEPANLPDPLPFPESLLRHALARQVAITDIGWMSARRGNPLRLNLVLAATGTWRGILESVAGPNAQATHHWLLRGLHLGFAPVLAVDVPHQGSTGLELRAADPRRPPRGRPLPSDWPALLQSVLGPSQLAEQTTMAISRWRGRATLTGYPHGFDRQLSHLKLVFRDGDLDAVKLYLGYRGRPGAGGRSRPVGPS